MENLFLTSARKKFGMMPGTMIFTGEKKLDSIDIELFSYNLDCVNKSHFANIDEALAAYQENGNTIYWLNINGLHDSEVIKKVGEKFDINTLFLEDILNVNQRPKLEIANNYLFAVFKMIRYDKNDDSLIIEQISVILGNNYLISFQETNGDVFDSIRLRLLNNQGKLRRKGTDYLFYGLLDMIIDNYFITLELLGDAIEELEESVLKCETDEIISELQDFKQQTRLLRRTIYPLREVIDALPRVELSCIKSNNLLYFKDLHDHLIQAIETIEVLRENIAGLFELHLANLSKKMNDIMKMLTILATIFIPLTFVAGIYGMNFDYMPELNWRLGYPAIWVVFVIITIFMLMLFRRKKWL